MKEAFDEIVRILMASSGPVQIKDHPDVDTDVLKELVMLVVKICESNVKIISESALFDTNQNALIPFLCETLVNVSEKELDQGLIILIQLLISHRHTKGVMVNRYLHHMVFATISSLQKIKGMTLDKLANTYCILLGEICALNLQQNFLNSV